MLIDYFTAIRVSTNPGVADQPLPVSTFGLCTDPVVIGPGITPFSGSFSMDVSLNAGSSFAGIPGPGSIDFSTIFSSLRIVPGAFADPDSFRQQHPDAIDTYNLGISDHPGGQTVDFTRGLSNNSFTLTFHTDPLDPTSFDPALVISRALAAFSGTYGNSSVLMDTYLFTIDVTLSNADMVYTIGPSAGGLAPDSETPEPSPRILFGLGIFCYASWAVCFRRSSLGRRTLRRLRLGFCVYGLEEVVGSNPARSTKSSQPFTRRRLTERFMREPLTELLTTLLPVPPVEAAAPNCSMDAWI